MDYLITYNIVIGFVCLGNYWPAPNILYQYASWYKCYLFPPFFFLLLHCNYFFKVLYLLCGSTPLSCCPASSCPPATSVALPSTMYLPFYTLLSLLPYTSPCIPPAPLPYTPAFCSHCTLPYTLLPLLPPAELQCLLLPDADKVCPTWPFMSTGWQMSRLRCQGGVEQWRCRTEHRGAWAAE